MQVEDQEKLRRFNSDWDSSHSTEDKKPPMEVGNSDGGESLMDSIATTNVNQMSTYTPPPIPTTGDNCGQCGLLHPPVRPGEICPNASVNPVPQPVQEVPQPVQEAPQPLTEGETRGTVKPPTTTSQRPIAPPPAPKPIDPTPIVSEPAPLADNNIPTEIHVNKYLGSWGDMIQAHCNSNGINNVKKLMRHITIEITDFLESYKGK